jgi:hypothetical protein
MTAETSPAAAPEPRPLSVRLGIGSAIFQGLLVVLGVVLGFFITEWQADQTRNAEARQALAHILEEVAANRDVIAAAKAYHGEKLKALDAAARDQKAPDIRLFDRGFVAPAQVSSAAWSTASETGALADLPFDQVLALSRLYGQQAAYLQQQATVSSVIYPELFERGPQGIVEHTIGLRTIISTFFYREQQLEKAYADALTPPAG